MDGGSIRRATLSEKDVAAFFNGVVKLNVKPVHGRKSDIRVCNRTEASVLEKMFDLHTCLLRKHGMCVRISDLFVEGGSQKNIVRQTKTAVLVKSHKHIENGYSGILYNEVLVGQFASYKIRASHCNV